MRSSTRVWVAVYIILPLLPFITAGILRLLFDPGRPSWDTFSASELAFSLVILIVFVQQSIVGSTRLLENADMRADVDGWTFSFALLLILVTILFSVTVALTTLVADAQDHLEVSLRIVQGMIFGLFPAIIFTAAAAQRNFELKARL